MNDALPLELIEGAILRDREYAWELSAFPIALKTCTGLWVRMSWGPVLVSTPGRFVV